MSHGLGNGTCAVCLHGHLEGWSWGIQGRPTCGYKNCEKPAVFIKVPRVEVCCETCVKRPKVLAFGEKMPLIEAIKRYVQERKNRYERTDDDV